MRPVLNPRGQSSADALAERQLAQHNNESASDDLLVQIASVVEIVAEIESCNSVKQAVQKAANFVAAELHRSSPNESKQVKVHIGLAKGTAAPVLQTTSDAGVSAGNVTAVIEAAMLETKTRQRPTHLPAKEGNRHAALCLKLLAEMSQNSHLYALELTDNSASPVGVMIVESNQPITNSQLTFCDGCAIPLGSAIQVIDRAELNHVGKWMRAIADRWETQRMTMLSIIAGVVFALALIPFPYSVQSHSELQPKTRRFVSVPFDAKLAECAISPGDVVEKDQTLAQLDEQELRLELAQVEADLYRALKDQDGLLARHETGEAALAKLKADALRARQQLLRYRFQHLVLRSPIGGLVVDGDFKDAQGMPLSTGQTMFEIARLDELRIEILIPADDIRLVAANANVVVQFDALPFERFDLQIERIQPAAELRDGANVFVATAVIPNHDHRLRPGMQGDAKIRSSWMPIGWHYLRKPVASTVRWFGW
ncbi:MAG: efflux RND transporter periplasmic adaptor subunit [Planctomycetota bacterium]